MKTGGPITIAIDKHRVLFMRMKNRVIPELVQPSELFAGEQIMPVLIFRWSIGAGATFSLN